MEIIPITLKEEKRIRDLNEDHFNDFKSSRITPAKLQESFVAFANSDGGDLYVGIEDKSASGERVVGFNDPQEANAVISTLLEETNPAVENVLMEFLQTTKKGLILRIGIPKSHRVHYTASGDCYIRVNASRKKIKGERITALSYAKGAEAYEKKIVDNAELTDIASSDALKKYMRKVESQLDPLSFLRKQHLLTKRNNERLPNVCSVLLFDDNPQATLSTRCAVKVYRLRTTEKEYKREQLAEMPITINGIVEDIIEKTIKNVSTYIDGASFQDGDKLVKLLYPSEALKELLVNAVIHRDYSINDDIHVKIFDNRIEVQSPGKLPGYMTIENLYSERFSRNPNLVRMLHNLPNPVNHDIGEGLDTAKNELKKAGLVDPVFEEKDNAFIVTIHHKRLASIEDVILKYLDENPASIITNKLVRQLSGEDDMQKVKSALQKLRSIGEIELEDAEASVFQYRYKKAKRRKYRQV